MTKTLKNFQRYLVLSLIFIINGGMAWAQSNPGILLPIHDLLVDQNASGAPAIVTQTLALSEGANYCSFYVDITLNELKDALVASFPNSAITIKSKTQTHTYNPNTHRWTGKFDTFDLGKMNIIKVACDGELTLEGVPVKPADHPVTIVGGNSTYLAFPFKESMTLTEAFAGIVIQGDKVKSKDKTCAYNRNKWGNQITTLEPGKGYIYVGAGEDNRTLIFPTSSK